MRVFFVFCLMMICSSKFSFSQTATAPSAGDGTAGNPYQIATLENLYWIAANSANLDKHYIQTADIDASATINWFGGQGWIPIGNSTTRFTGQYDGQNHTISKVWINRPTGNYDGFFGCIQNATISNLKIENFNIKSLNYATGFVGDMNGGTINNCSSSGSISCSDHYCAGFVGRMNGGTINNCSSSGSATCLDGDSGGFVGYMYGGTISNCSSSGSAIAIERLYPYSGGFVGYMYGGTISNCSSSGSAVASAIGIFAISGGFIGNMDGGTINNCFSSGSASSSVPAAAYSGGFVGGIANGTISNCYAIGYVSAICTTSTNRLIEGFVGSLVGGSVNNSYWCTDIYPTNTAGGTGLTLLGFQNQNSFVGWDFVNTWKMSSPSSKYYGFPILQWMDTDVGEIALYGNDVSITNGDATPTENDFTNFGEAIANDETISRTFEVRNSGSPDLSLTGSSPYVTLSGANSALFSVTKIPSKVITQNGNTTFRVAYSPTSAGNHTATVNISNNDDDESTYTFAIQGTGVSTPSIQSNNISFSNISRTGMTVCWNRGNGDKTLLLGKQSYRIDDSPLSNGTTYPANSASFTDPLNATADGAKVLYNGSSLNPSVNITNLTRYKLYYFKVAEFNEVRENDDKIALYNQSESSNTPRSRWTLRKEDGMDFEPSEFVYPNPATNEINCEVIINETSDIRLEIYSMDSRLVKKINFGRYPEGVTKLTADINELSSGSYLLVYHLGEEQMMTIIDVEK